MSWTRWFKWDSMSNLEKALWYFILFCLAVIGAFIVLGSLAEGAVAQDGVYQDNLSSSGTQQVCISQATLVNPLTHTSLSIKQLCGTMAGRKHWVQYWPLGIQAVNEYGDILTLVKYTSGIIHSEADSLQDVTLLELK